MQTRLVDKPDFGMLQVRFDAPGEVIHVEPSAMVAKDSAVQIKTAMQGGFLGSLKNRVLGGESLFENTFTSSREGESLWLAPGCEGDLEMVDVGALGGLFMASGAFLARMPSVQLDTKWDGARGFFSGAGLFLLRASGTGAVWLCSYGAMHCVDLAEYGGAYIVDTSHVVAFTPGVTFSVRKVGGLKSLFLSGEGLVCDFRGNGKVWISTRNPGSLAAFLNPFRPLKTKVQTGSDSD